MQIAKLPYIVQSVALLVILLFVPLLLECTFYQLLTIRQLLLSRIALAIPKKSILGNIA